MYQLPDTIEGFNLLAEEWALALAGNTLYLYGSNFYFSGTG